MAKENFDWALVRSFLAVIDAGSLMGAARRLGAQQPTLSRHIAEFEMQLGVPLFERTGRGVTPTAAAIVIAESARKMQDGADTLSRALAGLLDKQSGSVRISCSQVAAIWLMPPLLAKLRLLEPGIHIELVSSNQISNLLQREADIAIRMLRPEQNSLIARKLADVPIVVAAHKSYLDRAGVPSALEDLLQHDLLGYDEDDTILRGFAALGLPLTRDRFVLRTDDQVAYGQLLAAGMGIGFVTEYLLDYWPDVLTLLPQVQIPPVPCWLAVHREIRSTPVVRRVYDFLGEEIPLVFQRSKVG